MTHKTPRILAGMASLTLLVGCAPPAPMTQDADGRGVVSGAVAANMFLQNCYNSPSGAAVKASKDFAQSPVSLEGAVSAGHKTLAADFVGLRESSCMFSFVGNKPSTQSAAEAAAVLQIAVKPTNIGGKPGGGQINMVTSKGNVVIGNGSKRQRNGFSILFFGRN